VSDVQKLHLHLNIILRRNSMDLSGSSMVWFLAVRVQVDQLERLLAGCRDKENSSAPAGQINPEHSACS